MGGVVGGVSDALFGSSGSANKGLTKFKPASFQSPGLDVAARKRNLALTRTPDLEGSLSGISNTFQNQATQFGELLPQLAPGFGKLTQAAQAAIKASIGNLRNQKSQAIGNLRENLARRRIGGSSFAADAVSRAEAEFSQKESELLAQGQLVEAESFLREIDSTVQLINEQAQAQAQSFQSFIDQSNFESGLAAQLASGVTTTLGANARQASAVNVAFMQERAGLVGSALGFGSSFIPKPS